MYGEAKWDEEECAGRPECRVLGVKGKRNGYGEVAFRERTSLSKEGEGKRLKNFMERSNSGIGSLGKCY